MKKSGCILLVIMLLLQSGGILQILILRQLGVQMEMSEKLNAGTTKFETLVLSFREYQKSRVNADEILVDGMMYDVRSITINGDQVKVIALSDHDEKGILDNIKTLVNQFGSSKSDLPVQLVQLISLLYLAPADGHMNILPTMAINKFLDIIPFTESGFSSLNIPPPKIS